MRSGTRIAYAAPEVAPIVGRFCSEIRRRTALRVAPTAGRPGPDEPSVQDRAHGPGRIRRAPGAAGCLAGRRRSSRRAVFADGRHRPGRSGRGGTGRRGARLDHPHPAAGGDAVRRCSGDLPARRPDPRRAQVRLAWSLPRPGPHVRHARRGPAADRPARAVQAQRAARTPDRRPELAPARGAPGRSRAPDGTFYSAEDLRALVAYAADRFVTVVPEVDMPGHASALVRMRPELGSGRNEGVELPARSQAPHRVARPGTARDVRAGEDVLTGVAEIFPGPYIHIGGDEPWGMPHDLLRVLRPAGAGLRPLDGQAPAGVAGVGAGRPRPGRHRSSTGSPASPSRRRCQPRSGRRSTRTSPWRAATSRRRSRRRCP